MQYKITAKNIAEFCDIFDAMFVLPGPSVPLLQGGAVVDVVVVVGSVVEASSKTVMRPSRPAYTGDRFRKYSAKASDKSVPRRKNKCLWNYGVGYEAVKSSGNQW